MNTQLEKLFSQHNLSQKDRYEIRQMYSLLPNHKQRELIENFAVLASKFTQIEQEIQEQRDLLLWTQVDNIKQYTNIIQKNINLQVFLWNCSKKHSDLLLSNY